MNSGKWEPDEIERFEWALSKHGRDYKKITEHVRTRSHIAIKNRFCHKKDKSVYQPGRIAWTCYEKQRFVNAVRQFRDDRKKISKYIGSKSVKQVNWHILSIRKQLERN